MAKLIKEGARKPLIDVGTVFAGRSVDWSPEGASPGHLKGTSVYSLTIMAASGDRREHRLTMTRDEALRVIRDWTAEMVTEGGG